MENLPTQPKFNDKKSAARSFWWPISHVIHRLRSGLILGPLTTRSVIGLLLILYLLLGPIQRSTDIVSAALTYAFLIVLSVLVIAAIAHGTLLKKAVVINVLPPHDPAISGTTVRVFLSIQRARILPFFSLDIALDFEHGGASPALVRVSGLSQAERHTYLDIVFPHRGSWDIRSLKCSLHDVTGFSRFTWQIPLSTAITVAPPQVLESRLPVLSSTQRPGEMMIDVFNRQGEPFDIKSYHPSDGVKKIVWKAFAKRGELLSRHPEASMTPEGFVVIFVVAGPEGDTACANAMAYTTSLAKLNLEIIASCEGAHGRSPAHSPEAFKELLIDSVWDTAPKEEGPLRRDAAALLDYCKQLTPSITVSKLLLFSSAERINVPGATQELHNLAEWLSHQGITPVFCLTTPPVFTESQKTSPLSMLRRLVVAPEPSQNSAVSGETYNNFLSSCLHRQWEVHV